ncbi:MAG: hypothetical protein HY237_06985 [Acidobacteria bacterium]|nr:hypothetical protein [Acidobacteriota bacterium]
MMGLTGWLLAAMLLAPSVELEHISSAEMCGRCHRDILRAWKTSIHATALENPLFQDALERAEEDFGSKVRSTCLGCHAPTVQYSGDTGLIKKVSWEGVTCDFCHSLKSVTLTSGAPRLVVAFDGIKTGPLKDAVSNAHGVAFSEVHISSLVCAGCHEYRNPQGLAVLTTYTEWQNSSYGQKGTHCQDCHMYSTSAKVVDPKVKRVKETTVNLHQMPGSRSVEQLNKAIQSQMSTSRQGGKLKVIVKLTNAGAGHYVPTGSPMRQLILEVRLDPFGEGPAIRAERVYARMITDQKGVALQREHLSISPF